MNPEDACPTVVTFHMDTGRFDLAFPGEEPVTVEAAWVPAITASLHRPDGSEENVFIFNRPGDPFAQRLASRKRGSSVRVGAEMYLLARLYLGGALAACGEGSYLTLTLDNKVAG